MSPTACPGRLSVYINQGDFQVAFKRNLIVAGLLAVLWPAVVLAEVKVASIFTDHMVLQRDQSIVVWGWADPGEKVAVNFSRTDGTKAGEQATTQADAHGSWEVTLGKYPTGGTWALQVRGANTIDLSDILIGDVWLCSGQSNMQLTVNRAQQADQEYAKVDKPAVRMFSVKRTVATQPQKDLKGGWIKADPQTVMGMSAAGYFFGRALHEHLHIPIGLVHSSWGGTRIETWLTPEAMAKTPGGQEEVDKWRKLVADFNVEAYQADKARKMAEYEAQLNQWKTDKAAGKQVGQAPRKPRFGRTPMDNQQGANHLYFSMIHPLQRLKIRGVIWYQGESNARGTAAYNYRYQLAQLVLGWREFFGQPNLPLFWVQLPGFGPGGHWPMMRESMMDARKVPNADMAIALGLGEAKNIHPGRKREVGERLALVARHIAYGEDLVWQGPIYKSMKVDGHKAILEFDHIGKGLKLEPQKQPSFEIAGEDKKFVPAQVKLEGDRLVVWADDVAAPKSVRYAWSAMPAVWLYNSAGLPASPFRTDDWPIEGLTP